LIAGSSSIKARMGLLGLEPVAERSGTIECVVPWYCCISIEFLLRSVAMDWLAMEFGIDSSMDLSSASSSYGSTFIYQYMYFLKWSTQINHQSYHNPDPYLFYIHTNTLVLFISTPTSHLHSGSPQPASRPTTPDPHSRSPSWQWYS